MDVPFDLALAQAIAWCAPRADPADPTRSLRSSLLRPRVPDDGGRREASSVRDVVDVRSYSDPATKAATAVQSASDLQGGRLLLYFPDEELADGAAEAESDGFFDTWDAPPWDTWVALLGENEDRVQYSYHGRARHLCGPHLVSWVPPSFVNLVSAGIAVSMLENIRWLDDTDVPLRAQLRERGLIT